MNPIFDNSTIDAFFADDAQNEPTWIGNVFQVATNREVIPFTFEHIRYLMILGAPIYEAGDEESFLNLSSAWADGFNPKDQSRVMKFCRADAVDEHFQPDRWKLPNPLFIFSFCKTVTAVVEHYVESCPDVEQFFFWPTTSQLETFYKRVFRCLNRGCLNGQFVPILEPLGVFNGYQKP